MEQHSRHTDHDRPQSQQGESLPDLDLQTLIGAHGEQLHCFLEDAELRGRLVLMTIVKAAAGTLLIVLAAFSAWMFLTAALLLTLIAAGLPIPAVLAAGGLLMILTTAVLWRGLLRLFRQRTFSSRQAGEAT